MVTQWKGPGDMEWLDPWYSVEDEPTQVAGMAQELARELPPGHELYGLAVSTLARRDGCDDVLFQIDDGSGRVAMVHLTWTTSPPETLPWPMAAVYPSIEMWMEKCMRPDHDDFSA